MFQIDDRFVQPLVDLALVTEPPDIDRVREDVVDGPRICDFLWIVGLCVCLNDYGRITTRYDRSASNFFASRHGIWTADDGAGMDHRPCTTFWNRPLSRVSVP